MNFIEAITSCFAKYTIFTGRAIRSEYWYWRLFELFLVIISYRIDLMINSENIMGHFSLFIFFLTFIPSFAVSIRRLHDLNKTGWWMLLVLTGIGNLLLLYWFIQKGNSGKNFHGEDPLVILAKIRDDKL